VSKSYKRGIWRRFEKCALALQVARGIEKASQYLWVQLDHPVTKGI
jgi:hypothetical protein